MYLVYIQAILVEDIHPDRDKYPLSGYRRRNWEITF
jgi:hypothetical protein